jgi:hypothetical protein
MQPHKSLLIIGIAAKKPMEDENVIEFPAPKGFTPPDNAKEGDTFEALATLRMQADGVLQLNAIDGMPVMHDAKQEAQEEKDESPEESAREDQMSEDQESATSTEPSEDQADQGEDGDFLKAVMGGLKKKGMNK